MKNHVFFLNAISHPNIGKHITPILVLFATAVVGVIYVNSDITILGLIKTDTDVAIYGVSSRIYILVKQVVNSIAQVTIPRISLLVAKGDEEKIRKICDETFETVILLLFPIIAGLILLRYPIIGLISGKNIIQRHYHLLFCRYLLSLLH